MAEQRNKKLKILVCTYEYYPKGSGIANVAYYVVQNLKKSGHECTVISSNAGDIQLDYDTKIRRYAGIGLLLFWEQVRKYIKKHDYEYDLIWTHNPLFFKKTQSKKIYSTVHTTYVKYWDLYRHNRDYSLPLKAYYYLMKKAEARCYRLNQFRGSVVSPAVKKELLALGIAENSITYIPNGVDTEKFTPLKRSKTSKTSIKNLVCVGRVSYQKNPYGLTRAIAQLNKNKQKVNFTWIGDGELLETMRTFVKNNNIKGVKFAGKIDHDKILSAYQQGDAYVLASIYEGQPLTLLEAMSCGLPCIVSDIENMSHLIQESKCGLVVNFNDSISAAKEIEKYLFSPKLDSESKTARSFALKKLDWKIITQRYLDSWQQKKKK